MQTILNVYKPKGLTPLQTIHLLREKHSEYNNKTIGFAGRLDPLAHGVLLLMIDKDTTKENDTYLNLSKDYEVEAVFGVSTDSYDALGLLNNQTMKQKDSNQNFKTETEKFIKSKLGKQTQTYPAYSSKTVRGKPLYWWARQNKLSEIEIPTREIEIYDFTLLATNKISSTELEDEIMQQINSVNGDFRQKAIKKKWKLFFTKLLPNSTLPTARFKISCSTGTYIRSLIHQLGEYLGVEAISLEILRTKVGKYSLENSLHIT